MHLSKAAGPAPLFFLLLATVSTSSPTSSAPSKSAVAKPYLDKLFTATLQLGQPLKPIAIPGGARLVEPIANGVISGPAFNATVTGGAASPIFYDGMTTERPDIIVYGNTDKNGSFFATLQGVGSPVDQYVRIEVDVGPPYTTLNESFILGEILRVESGGASVTVNAYLLEKAK